MSEVSNQRNKPCPCRSGKKYKKCCLIKKSSNPLLECESKTYEFNLSENCWTILEEIESVMHACAFTHLLGQYANKKMIKAIAPDVDESMIFKIADNENEIEMIFAPSEKGRIAMLQASAFGSAIKLLGLYEVYVRNMTLKASHIIPDEIDMFKKKKYMITTDTIENIKNEVDVNKLTPLIDKKSTHDELEISLLKLNFPRKEINKILHNCQKREQVNLESFIKPTVNRGLDFFKEVFGYHSPTDVYKNALDFLYEIRNITIHKSGIVDEKVCNAANKPGLNFKTKLKEGDQINWHIFDVIRLCRLLMTILTEVDPLISKKLNLNTIKKKSNWCSLTK